MKFRAIRLIVRALVIINIFDMTHSLLKFTLFTLTAFYGLINTTLAQQTKVPHTSTFPGIDGVIYPYASPESLGFERKALKALTDSVINWVANKQLMGAEFMIIKDEKIVLHESVGWSDYERNIPLERNSIFNMRSMSKPFLSTSILMLQEDGKLNIEEKVSKYLGSFDNEKSRNITIRQLLTHTAGYDFQGFAKPRNEYENLADVVNDIGINGPQFTPGSRYVYSDAGSSVLGALIAYLSDMPLEYFIQQRIIDRIGMTDTYTAFTKTSNWANRVNSNYLWSQEDQKFNKFWDNTQESFWTYYRGSAGLFSTMLDYSIFLNTWMKKGDNRGINLLTEHSIDLALQPYATNQYGFQWFVRKPFESESMPLVFGHGGSDGTMAMAFHESNTMVLYFTQSRMHHKRGDFFRLISDLGIISSSKFVNENYNYLKSNPLIQPSDVLQIQNKSKFIGLYKTPEDAKDQFEMTIRTENGKLRFKDDFTDGFLIPIEVNVFAPGVYYESDDVFEYEEKVRFIFNITDGEITGVKVEFEDGVDVLNKVKD